MKYEQELIINAPLLRAVALFQSIEDLQQWQPDLLEHTHQSGTPGATGATATLTYQMGKRTIDMIETLVKVEPPHEFIARYESGGVWNEVVSHFNEVDDSRTKWHLANTFKCRGFALLYSIFARRAFKQQTVRYMQDFAHFVENKTRQG